MPRLTYVRACVRAAAAVAAEQFAFELFDYGSVGSVGGVCVCFCGVFRLIGLNKLRVPHTNTLHCTAYGYDMKREGCASNAFRALHSVIGSLLQNRSNVSLCVRAMTPPPGVAKASSLSSA